MSIIDKHVITNEKNVSCKICGKKLEVIESKHLKTHNITLDEYLGNYPNTPTITKERLEKDLISIQNRKNGKKLIENKTKDVPCIFHPDKIITVNINSGKTGLCDECKKNGLIHPNQQKAINKMRNTIRTKYNVENVSELKEVNEKRKEKWLNKTDEEKEKIIEKREKSLKERFGENWELSVHELSKKGMLEKYGVDAALKYEDFVLKFKNTWNSKSGDEINEISKKIKNTKEIVYGNPNYTNREKINKTNQEKYGGNSPTCSKAIIEVRERKRNLRKSDMIKKFLRSNGLELLDEFYINCYHSHKFKCLKCNHEFFQSWNSIQQGFTCPNCRPLQVGPTKPEVELYEYVKTFNFKNISFSNRTLIEPWELDIVIHDLKIAIEYNGLFWHHDDIIRETRKKLKDSRQYHSMKRIMCEEKGYRLITIFEDEWVFKKDIVIGRLDQILKKQKEKINGRDCIISEISTDLKNEFLDKYHIQGRDSSIIKLGAFYNENLVSIMTFSKGNISKGSINKDDVWELNRFCINYNYNIPGIAGKLLEFFKRNYKWKEIFSYADLRWSVGNLYRILNFTCDEKVRLNYWYIDVNKIKRIHRFSLRKRPDEPKDVPEYLLRMNEGYKIIWDCGSLKFNLKNI